MDTFWVENLNTMLDDTRMLCLANSERIALTDKIRLIFETDSLSQASPPIVSRCGMVYMVSFQNKRTILGSNESLPAAFLMVALWLPLDPAGCCVPWCLLTLEPRSERDVVTPG